MTSKILIWLSTLLAMSTLNANPDNIQEQCTKAFYADQFQTVIDTCQKHQIGSPEIQYLVKASEVFSKISHHKIHDIFLDQRLGGQGKRRYERGTRWLFNDHEEYLLKQHITVFNRFEQHNIPEAIFWSAVLYYIDEFSLAESDGRTKDKSFMQGRAERIDHHYNMRLETYHALIPNNPQVNFLLGLEGIKLQLPSRRDMSDPTKLKALIENKNRTMYYSIEDPRYYDFMLMAGDAGFEPALRYIKGVDAWQQRLQNLTKQAEQSNLSAMTELGEMAHRNNNIEVAIKWLSQAGAAGDIQSLKTLGLIYLREQPDPYQYLKTIQQLVKLDDVDAILTLGDYHACSGNSKKAKKLYKEAQSKGHALAVYALSDLEEFGEPPSGCRKFKPSP